MTNAMTLQRQYSLPNCTLILEGLSDTGSTGQVDFRPVMSLLINAECHLPGQEKPLVGGREFFESLVTAVSLYAQEFLSGIHLPRHTYSDRPSFVRLERLDRAHHRLIVEKDPNNANSEERTIDLTTVQLFDLVEAIDQFVADTQTLPYWSLNLSPVPKRYARSGEPIAKQVVPASIGVSGLALAAIAFFSMPTMRVKTPECLSPGAPDCPGVVANNQSPGASPNPTTSPSPTTSPTAQASPSPTASPDLTQGEAALNTAPPIADAAELKTLSDRLSDQIRQRWTTQAQVTEELAYRVGVARNGDVIGFKAETPAALDRARQTPLLDLLYIPATGSTPSAEPLAQYRVVFKPQGNFEVTPISSNSSVVPPSPATIESPAASPSPSPVASPSPNPVVNSSPSPAAVAVTGTELTDRATLEALQPKLYDAIDQNWQGRPPFDKDLVFRVRVKPDGTIAGFQPENQLANEFAKDTPLPQLGKPIDPNAPAEPAASFKVVFRPSGVLQINPWFGARR